MKQRIYIDTYRYFRPMAAEDKEFDTVTFFRNVKEKMAKATEGMTLPEKQNYWKMMREGKIKL